MELVTIVFISLGIVWLIALITAWSLFMKALIGDMKETNAK